LGNPFRNLEADQNIVRPKAENVVNKNITALKEGTNPFCLTAGFPQEKQRGISMESLQNFFYPKSICIAVL
jgi:hypothetical protein